MNAIYANLKPFKFGSLYVRIIMDESVDDHTEQFQAGLRWIYVHLENFNFNSNWKFPVISPKINK